MKSGEKLNWPITRSFFKAGRSWIEYRALTNKPIGQHCRAKNTSYIQIFQTGVYLATFKEFLSARVNHIKKGSKNEIKSVASYQRWPHSNGKQNGKWMSCFLSELLVHVLVTTFRRDAKMKMKKLLPAKVVSTCISYHIQKRCQDENETVVAGQSWHQQKGSKIKMKKLFLPGLAPFRRKQK